MCSALFTSCILYRPISGVRGFTRETVIAVSTNIEGREFRRRKVAEMDGTPDNSRASTTDDVECFFSVFRDNLGSDFTLKHVRFEWRKWCVEYTKRMDPNLPFYYYTSSHDRFLEGPRPSFNDPSTTHSKQSPIAAFMSHRAAR